MEGERREEGRRAVAADSASSLGQSRREDERHETGIYLFFRAGSERRERLDARGDVPPPPQAFFLGVKINICMNHGIASLYSVSNHSSKVTIAAN